MHRIARPARARHVRRLTRNTYILDAGGNPKRQPDFNRWFLWMQQHDQPLAQTMVAPGVFVVTRFMGIDHEHPNTNRLPALWQTMIFGGPHDLHCVRHTSQARALKGHEQAVAFAKDQRN